jgi:hypothetical protein
LTEAAEELIYNLKTTHLAWDTKQSGFGKIKVGGC